MHLNLKDHNYNSKIIPNVRVEKIQHQENLDLWIKPIQEEFGFTAEVSNAFLDCFRNSFAANQFVHYIAFYDNKLAGSLSLFLNKNSIGIYNGAVFKKFQNNGIMTYFGNTLLNEIKTNNINDIVTQANDLSRYICEQAGFKYYLKYRAFLSGQT